MLCIAMTNVQINKTNGCGVRNSERKEAWMWFLHYLRRYVTPQPNLCIISGRGTCLLATLQSEQVVNPQTQHQRCPLHKTFA